MIVEITTNEYRDLLDILHIADVVLSGHRREPDKRSTRHRVLIQKLYGQALGEGLDGLFNLNGPENVYVPTAEFEEHTLAHVLIDEFSDHLFWDELISRLSVRDAAHAVGGMDRLNALNDNDRQAVEGPIRQHYTGELSRFGIANLAVIDRFDNGGEDSVRTSD